MDVRQQLPAGQTYSDGGTGSWLGNIRATWRALTGVAITLLSAIGMWRYFLPRFST